jgi:hypothetical protein
MREGQERWFLVSENRCKILIIKLIDFSSFGLPDVPFEGESDGGNRPA